MTMLTTPVDLMALKNALNHVTQSIATEGSVTAITHEGRGWVRVDVDVYNYHNDDPSMEVNEITVYSGPYGNVRVE